MKVRDHQLDSPRLQQVEQDVANLRIVDETLQSNVKAVTDEVVAARSDKFLTLGERLDYLMKNAGGGGGLASYEEVVPATGVYELKLGHPYVIAYQQLLLYRNGHLLTAGETADFTEVDGRTVRLRTPTVAGDHFVALVLSRQSGQALIWFRQQIAATAGQTIFDLAQEYEVGLNGIQVYKNGVLQTVGAANDYTELSPTRIQMTVAATATDGYLFLFPRHKTLVTWFRNQYVMGPADLDTLLVGREYLVGSNALQVYRNGVLQKLVDDYVEVDAYHVRFVRVPWEQDETVHFILPYIALGDIDTKMDSLVAENRALSKDLRKTNFKADFHLQAYGYGGSQAHDMLQDTQALDTTLSSGYVYNPVDQQAESVDGGVLVSVNIDAGPRGAADVLLYWDGQGVAGEISRDDGVTYVAAPIGALVSLADKPAGSSLRIRFTLAAGARLFAWGVVWR